MIPTEGALVRLALALIGDQNVLTAQERRLTAAVQAPSAKVLETTRELILGGYDPLGDAFCTLRGPDVRRSMGATYTPPAIVDAMLEWAAAEPTIPARIVDPGAGSGRYLAAAATRFPDAALVAIELDPLACLLLRANAQVLGFADRLTVQLTDYRAVKLPRIAEPTLYIGNPPYVRHHDISEKWKTWFADNAAAQGFKASKLAGLHIHFFLKTRELAQAGDFGTFITAAEWLDVNYGSVLRDMLADGLGGSALHVINPQARPFVDAMATGAITCFRVGNRPSELTVRTADSLDNLAPLSNGRAVDWGELSKARRWSGIVRGDCPTDPSMIELGELFRVHRGQVTGSNHTWIENPAMAGVPPRYLQATVTRARDLITAGVSLNSPTSLRRVLDLPSDLDELTVTELRAVKRFLKWAKDHDAHAGYVASHRRAWWSVQLRDPAPILCTYMARSAPTFVRNAAGARHLNIAHGLYPREALTEKQLQAILAYLRNAITTDGGRIYAGGLVKFEPRELERLRIPALDQIHDYADSLDNRPTSSRRSHSERSISR